MLRAARARFALTLARAKIYSNTGALPQPPSGEPRSPEPLCAARYIRAISVFTKNKFHAKVFPLSPLTQYILVPLEIKWWAEQGGPVPLAGRLNEEKHL